MVLPGTYQAKLTVGNWSSAEHFRILLDPRVAADGVTQSDLAAQESLSLRVMKVSNRARETQTRIQKERKSLTEQIKQGGRAARQAQSGEKKLDGLYSRLVTAQGPYPTPKLIDQLNYLYRMLDQTDQKPGRDAYQRLDELEQLLSEILSDLSKVLESKTE